MAHSTKHRCRIDCSNPTEVLSHLQGKSDHLYRFWMNYNELYNKCQTMSIEIEKLRAIPVLPVETKPAYSESDRVRIAELETQNARLRQEIARLKDQRKTVVQRQTNELAEGYDREIKRLKDSVHEKDQIIATKNEQIRRQMNEYDALRRTLSDERNKWNQERDQLQHEISELKRQLNRPKTPAANNTRELEQLRADLRKKDDEIRGLKIIIRTNEQKYHENLRAQLELARKQLKGQFQNLMSKLRDGCMSITTVVQSYEPQKVI